MPCLYDGPSDVGTVHDELDKLTRMLCALCAEAESDMIGQVPGLSSWWNTHKKFDEQRRKQKAEEDRIEAVRQKALKKLTPEERRILLKAR